MKKIKILPSDSTQWYLDNGDNTLRINYPELDKDSVVVDLGARHGSWSDQIRNKYFPQIFCFEVVSEFCEELRNKGYSVFKNAVYNKDGIIKIGIEEGEGSVYHEDNSFEVESIEARRIFEVIEKDNIDLIKINVEGAEYSILDNLIKSKKIKNIKNLQIQFHIIETYEKEYDRIRKELEKTHRVTWRYPFVWENWEII
jgi:FkbM family methyltransferase